MKTWLVDGYTSDDLISLDRRSIRGFFKSFKTYKDTKEERSELAETDALVDKASGWILEIVIEKQ